MDKQTKVLLGAGAGVVGLILFLRGTAEDIGEDIFSEQEDGGFVEGGQFYPPGSTIIQLGDNVLAPTFSGNSYNPLATEYVPLFGFVASRIQPILPPPPPPKIIYRNTPVAAPKPRITSFVSSGSSSSRGSGVRTHNQSVGAYSARAPTFTRRY